MNKKQRCKLSVTETPGDYFVEISGANKCVFGALATLIIETCKARNEDVNNVCRSVAESAPAYDALFYGRDITHVIDHGEEEGD